MAKRAKSLGRAVVHRKARARLRMSSMLSEAAHVPIFELAVEADGEAHGEMTCRWHTCTGPQSSAPAEDTGVSDSAVAAAAAALAAAFRSRPSLVLVLKKSFDLRT